MTSQLAPRSNRLLVRTLLAGLAIGAAMVACRAVHAEGSKAQGANTGDGSTPFTGLAQAPEANLFVGSSTTSIPIEVPAGRKMLTPKLALTYNSGGGPSPFGLGWDLQLGRIQRCGKRGVLSCDDATYRNDFVLVLPGANVECTLDPASGICRPGLEESFIRIQYQASSNQWDAWDKSGLHYVFGHTISERLGTSTTDLFVPASGGQPCSYTYSWALTSITDSNQNDLVITYQEFDANHTLYPQTILYGGNQGTGMTTPFTVNFIWQDRAAEDQPSNSLGGFRAKLTKRIERIEVKHSLALAEPANPVIRSYNFTYQSDRLGRQSLLHSVLLRGKSNTPADPNDDPVLTRADGQAASTLFSYSEQRPTGPPTENQTFGFSAKQHTGALPILSPTLMRNTVQVNGGKYTVRDLVDMDGDGTADLVDAQWRSDGFCAADPNGSSFNPGYWKVYRGTKSGYASVPLEWYLEPTWGAYGEPFPSCDLRVTSSADGATKAWRDTIDLTGDGIVDYVIAGTTSWTVFPGRAPSPNNGWGFGPPMSWNAPKPFLRRSESVTDFLGWDGTGSADTDDLVDMNADGRPDFVSRALPQGLIVWFNTGSGFSSTPVSFGGAFSVLRFTTAFGLTVLGLNDMNGDGLPDQIFANQFVYPITGKKSWYVYVNTGQRVSTGYESWPIPISCLWESIPNQPSDGLRRSANTGTDVVRDLFDINGDGLPDVVDSCGWTSTNKYWQVYLNRGGGFAPVQSWASPSSLIRDIDHHEPAGQAWYEWTFAEAMDADGDGLVDFVDFRPPPNDPGKISIARHAGGAWCAAASSTSTSCATTDGAPATIPRPESPSAPGAVGRPDMLVHMENGLGADTFLTYRPSTQWDNTDASGVPSLPFVVWTLTQIRQDDGLCGGSGPNAYVCDAASGVHELRTDLTYAFGLYDQASREFRGFRRVDQFAVDATQTTTFFLQDAARKGKVETSFLYPSGSSTPLSLSYNAWDCADITVGSASTASSIACPMQRSGSQRLWVRLLQSAQYDNADPLNAKAAVASNLAWDDYGNVTVSRKGGSGTAYVNTNTLYVPPAANGYIVDKPQQVWVTDGAGVTFEEKWFAYDGGAAANGVGVSPTRGNVRMVYSWLDQVASGLPSGVTCPAGGHGSVGSCVTTQMTYDNDSTPGYGNIGTVTDAAGRVTTTTYDTATQIYPVRVENALGHRVATAYDYGCGKLLSQTVPYPTGQGSTNQPRTQNQYDAFCRLEKTALPDETLGDPHVKVTYYLGYPGHPTSILTSTTEPWATLASEPRVRRDDLFDALGRHLQTQVDAVVDGGVTRSATGTVRFDARGNVDKQYSPFLTNLAGIFVRPATGASTISYQYDSANRVTRVTNPDGSYRVTEYNVPWQTTSKDECYTAGIGACPGGKSIERRDAFGRTVEKQLYKNDTFETATSYKNNVLGRLTETKQGTAAGTWAEATKITTTYDSLGRKRTVVDPDSGTWSYGYDLIGNLLHQSDPKAGQSIQFVYDALSRVTRKAYMAVDGYCALSSCSASVSGEVQYTYDDTSGVVSCQSDVCPTGHCALGRLVRVEEFPSTPGPSGNQTRFCDDVRGRHRQVLTTLAAAGSVVNVETGYTYDIADHVATIRYPDSEVVTYSYDEVGQMIAVDGHNQSQQAQVYLMNHTYDIFGRPRVIEHANDVTDAYTYNGASQSFRLLTLRTSAPGNIYYQKLLYDNYQANGLLRHITDELNPNSPTLGDTADFGYDGVGRLTSSQIGSPPTARSYTFTDHLNNLSSMTPATFTYGNAEHPHQATSNSAFGALQHDANGNRSWRGYLGHKYTYTADDRLQEVRASNDVPLVRFEYDPGGQRTAKVINPTTAHQVTWYFGDLMEVSDHYVTKYYFAGGRRIASQRYPRGTFLAANPPLVQIAGLSGGQLGLLVTLHQTAQWVVGITGVVLGLTLVFMPGGKRKAVVGIAVRRGPVIGVIVLFALTSLPLPIVVAPAWAGGGGGGGSPPPPSPTPTPYGNDTLGVMHYHYDHLGSVQAITKASGALFRQSRYIPYGLRGTFSPSGQNTAGCQGDEYCRAYTGYDYEWVSGLYYANARWYDPYLGMFLTHDPAREFASPYSYVGWNPTNGTDPSGQCELICAIIIGVIAGFAASAIQAGVNGASIGEALKAGVIGGAIGGLSAGIGTTILQPALGAVVSATTGLAPAAAADAATGVLITTGLGQAAYGLSQGDYSGIIGLGVSIGVATMLANGAQPVGGRDQASLGLESGRGGVPDWATVQKEFDFASIPPTSRGELVGELVINGRAQVRLDIQRYGSPTLRYALAKMTAARGPVDLSPHEYLINPNTGLRSSSSYGRALDFRPDLGIQIGPPAFDSYGEFARTYIHELGHASLGFKDFGPGFSAYDFERVQYDNILRQKGILP
jgi:RHS repeat-associated protein